MAACLRIMRGLAVGKFLPLKGESFLVGYAADCDIIVTLGAVSRRHARIVRRQGRHHIEDMNSDNGTWVNGEPVAGLTPLVHGDVIQLGHWIAVFLESQSGVKAAAEAEREARPTPAP